MIESLIPIGSIVRFANSNYLAVILGYFPDDGTRMYDYLAAPYPMGLASEEHAIVVDADGIDEVVARGFLDDEGKKALEAAVAIINAKEEAYVAIGEELDRLGILDTEPIESQDSFHMY